MKPRFTLSALDPPPSWAGMSLAIPDGFIRSDTRRVSKPHTGASLPLCVRIARGQVRHGWWLARSLGIPGDLLTHSVVRGPNHERGTWVHPQVAVNLAQCLMPRLDRLDYTFSKTRKYYLDLE